MGAKIGEEATPLDNAGTRPAYYGGAQNQFECIKVLEAWLTHGITPSISSGMRLRTLRLPRANVSFNGFKLGRLKKPTIE